MVDDLFEIVTEDSEILVRKEMLDFFKKHNVKTILSFNFDEAGKFVLDVKDIETIVDRKWYKLDSESNNGSELCFYNLFIMRHFFQIYQDQKYDFVINFSRSCVRYCRDECENAGRWYINNDKDYFVTTADVYETLLILHNNIINGVTFINSMNTTDLYWYFTIASMMNIKSNSHKDDTQIFISLELPLSNIDQWSSALYYLRYPYKIIKLDVDRNYARIMITNIKEV